MAPGQPSARLAISDPWYVLHQLAFAQFNDAKPQGVNQLSIVTGHNDRSTYLPELLKQSHDVPRQFRVKVSCGLIG